MPYQYLTFSDLYEEQSRPSARPPSPVIRPSSLSLPGFLLPSHRGSNHQHKMALSSSNSDRVARHASTFASGVSSPHDESVCQTSTQVARKASTSSSSSLHYLDFLKVWKRKSFIKHTTTDSALSTPTSSRRSSFTSHGFGMLHPASAASSANTSPAISRQVTKVSDYDALLRRTAHAEEDEERQRQLELHSYFLAAAQDGLSLRRT